MGIVAKKKGFTSQMAWNFKRSSKPDLALIEHFLYAFEGIVENWWIWESLSQMLDHGTYVDVTEIGLLCPSCLVH